MRFLLELIRTDTTFRFLGLSRNGWVSAGVFVLGVWLALRGKPVGASDPDPTVPEEGMLGAEEHDMTDRP
jgi:hypothetical protein